MNVVQKQCVISNFPEYLAIHNTGITMIELDQVVQLNRVSKYISYFWKSPLEDFIFT